LVLQLTGVPTSDESGAEHEQSDEDSEDDEDA